MLFFKQKKQEENTALDAETRQKIVVTDIEYLEDQLDLIDLTEQDLIHIRSFQPTIQTFIDEIINIFYDRLMKIDDLKQIIETKTTV